MGDTRLYFLTQSLSRLAGGNAADLSDSDLLECFCSGREEAAFALLVQRHGPVVLGVCKRLLANAADAEDAFQATFLVLLRKAGSIRKRASLGSWLYGVAYRVATRARARAIRHAVRAPVDTASADDGPLETVSRRELCRVLDEEVRRLPERFRAPLVLCGLEGKTFEQAARELKWPKSSLAHRLGQAKDLLRERLARRGVVFSAALLAALAKEASAAVTATLTLATVRLVGQTASGAAPAKSPAVALADGLIKEMAMTRWTTLLAAVSVLGLAVIGAVLLAGPLDQPPPPKTPEPPKADALPRDQPEPDGSPLPAGAVGRVGSARLRHGGAVYRLAFSPDGKTMASMGDEVLQLWDRASGKNLHHLDVPENHFFTECVFLDKGQTILVSGSGTCLYFDVRTGKEVRAVPVGPVGLKAHGRLSPMGDAVAFIRRLRTSQEVVLCDLPSGKERLKWETSNWDWEVAFSPDGKTLAAIDWDQSRPFNEQTRTVVLFDTASGKRRGEIAWGTERLGKLVFSADGKRLMAHHLGGGVRIWDTGTGREESSLQAPNGGLVVTAFSPDGSAVVLGSQYIGVPMLDVRIGKELANFGVQPTVTALTFTPDGKSLAAAGGAGTITLWDVPTAKKLPVSADPALGPRHLAFSADGREVWSFTDALTAHDWRTGKQTRRIEVPHDGDIGRLGLSSDRSLVAGVDGNQRLVVWDDAGRVVSRLGTAARIIFTTATFSPDGKRLYSGEWVGPIRVWDVAAKKELDTFDTAKHTTNVLRVSADGKLLAAADYPDAEGGGPEIVVWDLQKNRALHRLMPRPEGLRASTIALSADGTYLAAVGGNSGLKQGFVMVWDVRTGKEVSHRDGMAYAPVSVVFTPDGRSLITGEAGGAVRVWETATAAEQRSFSGHAKKVDSVAVSPDGRFAASASIDAPILIWDLTKAPMDKR